MDRHAAGTAARAPPSLSRRAACATCARSTAHPATEWAAEHKAQVDAALQAWEHTCTCLGGCSLFFGGQRSYDVRLHGARTRGSAHITIFTLCLCLYLSSSCLPTEAAHKQG